VLVGLGFSNYRQYKNDCTPVRTNPDTNPARQAEKTIRLNTSKYGVQWQGKAAEWRVSCAA